MSCEEEEESSLDEDEDMPGLESVSSSEKYNSMITKGDELKDHGRIKECIAHYTTTVNLCPYNFTLYMNRAHCYITSNNHRAALADGLRAVYLKPIWSKGHLRYIQGLDGCGMTEVASLARRRFIQLFPEQSDDVLDKTERKEPTAEDRRLFYEIMKKCKQELLQQCKNSTIPDAVCRYANCLSHNNSSRIWSNHQDYRGHVSLDCHEDCSIAYHVFCWRRYKTESEQKTDRDFLHTPCATPDCCAKRTA